MIPSPDNPSRARAWAEIDLAALRHNFAALQEVVGDSCGILSVLKANAYGHGAVAAAREVEACGAKAIGVANLEEGLELKHAGVRIPIVVLGALLDDEIEAAIYEGLEFSIFSLECIEIVNRLASFVGREARVHLMVDSGMGRLGVASFEIEEAFVQIRHAPNLELVGMATHFSSPGEADEAFTRQQIEIFQAAKRLAGHHGFSNLLCHAASHTALLRFPEARFEMVRPGLALFGLQLAGSTARIALRRVLSLHASVLHVKEIAAGTPISYSRLWQAPCRTRIATLSVGYNDGFRVGLTGQSSVLLHGVRCPVVGRVTMDYLMVDVGAAPMTQRGDQATLIGKQGQEEIRLEELSDALKTVPYEITCGLGRRVERRMLHAEVRSSQDSLRLVA